MAAGGCVSVRPVMVPSPQSGADTVRMQPRIRVLTTDGRYLAMRDAVIVGDSVVGWVATRDQLRVRAGVAVRDIKSVESERISAGRVLLVWIGVLVVSFVVGMAVSFG
jgi:hypothetical protein